LKDVNISLVRLP